MSHLWRVDSARWGGWARHAAIGLVVASPLSAQVPITQKTPVTTAVIAPKVLATVTFGPLTPVVNLGGTSIDVYLFHVNIRRGLVVLPDGSSIGFYNGAAPAGPYNARIELSFATSPGQVIAGWWEGSTHHESTCSLPQGPSLTVCQLPFSSVGGQLNVSVRVQANDPKAGFEVALGNITLNRFASPF